VPCPCSVIRRVRWLFHREINHAGAEILTAAAPPQKHTTSNWWQTEQGLIEFQNEVIKHAYYRLKYSSARFGVVRNRKSTMWARVSRDRSPPKEEAGSKTTMLPTILDFQIESFFGGNRASRVRQLNHVHVCYANSVAFGRVRLECQLRRQLLSARYRIPHARTPGPLPLGRLGP
jgi:hypothetical protein